MKDVKRGILVFDVETTGLPRNYNAPTTDLDNWPRIVQMAWGLYTDGGRELDCKVFVIKPDGFIIPGDAARVHGITTEKAEKEGVALKDVLLKFSTFVYFADILVAHNIDFDLPIIKAEYIRSGFETKLEKIPKFCTMKETVELCKLPGPHGYKWPRLGELYKELFGSTMENAHDAKVDVMVCAKCYFKLREEEKGGHSSHNFSCGYPALRTL